MAGLQWTDEAKASEYLDRIGRVEGRLAGERVLLEVLPHRLTSLLDLGCGDARLAGIAHDAHPELATIVATDRSRAMLDRAAERFRGNAVARVVEHDLNDPIPVDGPFDAIVSGFAIHHLADHRKASLLREIADRLNRGGVFVNLEVVECATPNLQRAFYDAIGRPGGDDEDQLVDVETNLEYMRSAGLRDVDCIWRWRGFALMAGWQP